MTTPPISIHQANAEFWNELCGTVLARRLGITDDSAESLRRFDRAYLDAYPYLPDRVGVARMAGKRVLEIGLGYGTLGQKIADSGAAYLGLDISPGPVAMMNHRLRIHALPGRALVGSVLDCPVRSSSVDQVVSIGCFHHTGNVQRCIDETYRVLKPSGVATLMVYNQFSYRQWLRWPSRTLRAWLSGVRGSAPPSTEEQRRAYDSDIGGRAAPETAFVSVQTLQRMLQRFSRVKIRRENCADIFLGFHLPHFNKQIGLVVPRKRMLSSVGRWAGLDLYITAWK